MLPPQQITIGQTWQPRDVDGHAVQVTNVLCVGVGSWVYCDQHLRAHQTGWCTVSPRNKVLLDAQTPEAAHAECVARGFRLYQG